MEKEKILIFIGSNSLSPIEKVILQGTGPFFIRNK